MYRTKYCTTIDNTLLKKTKAYAKANHLCGANDVIEHALSLYFQLLGKQIWEKELPNGKYQVVTIGNGNMCLDYVDKRIMLDTISDIQHLISDGYCCSFEV